MVTVTKDDINSFETDGVVLIRGLFTDYVDTLRAGVEKNMANPGPFASENEKVGETGLFFDDYCNWQRIPEFREVIDTSAVASVAAHLMRAETVQLFHDHVLVKEPGTSMATPWHSDGPYYFVEGSQTVSFWSPLDPVKEATLRLVAGSHRCGKPFLPTRWIDKESFFPNRDDYMAIPDPDKEGMRILEWEMHPGDAVAFNFDVLHSARGNASPLRRRAFSLRLVGDDARFIERSGPTSPPFPNHNMATGQKLRQDWFPEIWPKTTK
ncbi:phytanoyl-CoA dioxygenase family protein [Pseudopelagicola sp. nBUS_19]|uniref:phytanoyl-CoA dioxygenase family protein n=1 Tax=Pseudopelagicola sp. nBUS_19 TaxID=3395316 RepID=UPI003EB78568